LSVRTRDVAKRKIQIRHPHLDNGHLTESREYLQGLYPSKKSARRHPATRKGVAREQKDSVLHNEAKK